MFQIPISYIYLAICFKWIWNGLDTFLVLIKFFVILLLYSTRLSKRKRDSADTDSNSNSNILTKPSSEDGKHSSENECSNDAEKLKIKPDPDNQHDLESRLSSWDLDTTECITISDEDGILLLFFFYLHKNWFSLDYLLDW